MLDDSKGNSAKYSLLVGKDQFSNDLICLGEQLVEILRRIKESL